MIFAVTTLFLILPIWIIIIALVGAVILRSVGTHSRELRAQNHRPDSVDDGSFLSWDAAKDLA